MRAGHLEVHRLYRSLSCFCVAGFCTCPFLFSRLFKNHMSVTLIRRSITFPREVVEADGSVAICLGLHFSFFVDWYHRGWEHAKYTNLLSLHKGLSATLKVHGHIIVQDKTSNYLGLLMCTTLLGRLRAKHLGYPHGFHRSFRVAGSVPVLSCFQAT